MRRSAAWALLLAFFFACEAGAQEPSSAPASASPTGVSSVRINFLPPPLEGSISLGIYDTQGKLVRVLHREADLDDFEIGNDGLSTKWDGRNDAGENLPAGKYHARGYVIGNLQVEGVGFFFNDWVTDDDSPHLLEITDLWPRQNGGFGLEAITPESRVSLSYDEKGNPAESGPRGTAVVVVAGKVRVGSDEPMAEFPVSGLNDSRSATCGRGQTVWLIDGREVKQFSFAGEFLRRLSAPPDAPTPLGVAASETSDQIFLLEKDADTQRVRALTLTTSKQDDRGVSDWNVDFEKKIIAHKNFGIENGKPVTGGGKTLPEKTAVKLQSNPLEKDARLTVELSVGFGGHGSFLQTIDGLPLESISETPNLRRVVLAPRGEKSIDVFQDDDAVVEQFRISGLDQMMSFDCGVFDLN